MPETYCKDVELNIHIPVFFLKNGNAAPYYILTDPISNQAAGYLSCINDLDEAASNLIILKGMLSKDEIPYQAKKSLYLAAVITYMRCFNDGEGRSVQLQFDRIFTDSKQISLHLEIKDIRNKNFAHAGGGNIDAQRVILYFDPENLVSGRLEIKINVLNLAYGHDIDRFLELIAIAKQNIKSKLDKVLPVIQEKIVSKGVEELYSQSKIPDSTTFVNW